MPPPSLRLGATTPTPRADPFDFLGESLALNLALSKVILSADENRSNRQVVADSPSVLSHIARAAASDELLKLEPVERSDDSSPVGLSYGYLDSFREEMISQALLSEALDDTPSLLRKSVPVGIAAWFSIPHAIMAGTTHLGHAVASWWIILAGTSIATYSLSWASSPRPTHRRGGVDFASTALAPPSALISFFLTVTLAHELGGIAVAQACAGVLAMLWSAYFATRSVD